MSPSFDQIKGAVEQTKTLGDTIRFGMEVLATEPLDEGLAYVAYYALERQYADRPYATQLPSLGAEAAALKQLLINAVAINTVIAVQKD